MSHVAREKARLLNRLKRLRGQIEAIERAVDQDAECARVLQQATACRGAIEAFIVEVLEDHIRDHLAENDPEARAQASEELVGIIRMYLR